MKRSKFKSVKFWVTLWAMVMVTYVVAADRAAFVDIAKWLCGVPLAYIGANVAQKKIYADREDGQNGME